MKDQNEWNIIDVYSRKEAIADGFQVAVPEAITREAGIVIPVFMTRTAWDKYVEVPKSLPDYGQSVDGRLWDVLSMFRWAAQRNREKSSFDYQLTVVIPSGNGEGDWEPNEKRTRVKNHRLVTLTAVIGATDFDNPAPCITIMKPHDD